MSDEIFILTQSFGAYSSGTQFRKLAEEGGYIARCETLRKMNGEYQRVDIPLSMLTKKRNREQVS